MRGDTPNDKLWASEQKKAELIGFFLSLLGQVIVNCKFITSFVVNKMVKFITQLREEAIYFKLTSNSKYGEAVSINDVIETLKNLSDSYLAFVNAEYEKISKTTDKKKLKNVLKGLLDENNLMVVDLKFESCGMAVSPNFMTYSNDIPDIKNPLDWKNNIFNEYKSDILSADYNDEGYLKKIEGRYSVEQRQKIFKPIIDGILSNSKSKIVFGIGGPNYNLKLVKPSKKHYNQIVSDNNYTDVLKQIDTITTSFARVELRSGKIKHKPKILELFEDIENIFLPIKSLEFNDTTYKFKYPLYCELISEDGNYLLQNEDIGIFATGANRDEAKLSFAEEFDYIYKRYNSLPKRELTDDVISIRTYLNSIIEH